MRTEIMWGVFNTPQDDVESDYAIRLYQVHEAARKGAISRGNSVVRRCRVSYEIDETIAPQDSNRD